MQLSRVELAMRHRVACVAAIISIATARGLAAQPAPDPVGTWRGTSLCQVRPSACHDERVVFRITRTAAHDSLTVDGRKIVNGEEVEMGILSCRLDSPGARLTCHIPGGEWRFTIRGDSLVGELRLPNGTKARDVRAARSPGGPAPSPSPQAVTPAAARPPASRAAAAPGSA